MNANIIPSLLPLAIAITDCHPDPANARKGHAIDRIAASLRQYGQRKPIVVNASEGGKIEAGNGTWLAARSLGWTHIAAVMVEDDPMTAVGYGVADNRLGHLSEWDAETLATLLDSLSPETYTGFEGDELEGLLAELVAELDAGTTGGQGDAEPQTDRAEELRQQWGTELGQLWQIGEHRLIVGDCTDRAVVKKVMGGEQCKTLFFDPPWDIDAVAPSQFDTVLAFGDGSTMGDIVRKFGPPTWVFAWDCVSCWYTPNRPLRRMKLCAWYGDIESYNFDGWHYGDAGEARTVWNTRGEYLFTPDPRGKHLADLYAEPITKLHSESEHSHSKPLAWTLLLMANCTSGPVYDPFAGSGTTIVACQNLSRRGYAIEISPAYCAVILQRMVDAFPGIDIRQVDA